MTRTDSKATPQGHGQVLSGLEAVARVEEVICGDAATRDPAAAEGLALAGWRSASLPDADRSGFAGGGASLPLSCVHHVNGESVPEPDQGWAAELSAASLQEAVDQALVAHLVSGKLGRAGLCALGGGLTGRLGLVRIPDGADVEALLGDKRFSEDEPDADSDRVVELVGQAFAAVAQRTGRDQALVDAAGAPKAELVVVAAGAAIPAARRAVDAVATAGAKARVVGLRLLAPFPFAAVRDAVGSPGTVLVLDDPARPGGLPTQVRRALDGDAVVVPVVAPNGSDPAYAIVEAIGRVLPEGAVDAATVDEPADQAFQLIVAPGGPWGDALARRVAASLGEDGLAIRRTASGVGPATFEVAGAALLEPKAERDLIIASHPAVLEAEAVLGAARPGSVVLVHSRAGSSLDLAKALTPAQREALRANELALGWVDALAGDAPSDDEAFADGLVRAAVAGFGAAKLREGAAAGPMVMMFDQSALDPGRHVEEVDFRSRDTALTMPEPGADAASDAWRKAIWRFHLGGGGALAAAGPAPGVPVVPAALRKLAAAVRGAQPFPIVTTVADGALRARPLGRALEDAIEVVRGEGIEARVLADNVDVFGRRLEAEVLGGDVAAPVDPSSLGVVGVSLADELSLPQDGDRELRESLQALAGAWPAESRLIGLSLQAPLALHLATLQAARSPARAAFLAELRELDERLEELLLVDDLKAPGKQSADAVASSLGSLGDLFDVGALAKSLPKTRGVTALSAERRGRIDGARDAIRGYLEAAAESPSVVYVARSEDALASAPAGCGRLTHPEPLAAAAGVFDGLARRLAPVIAAMRLARLEADNAYRAEVHEAALAALDWEAFTAEELALVPPVVAVTTGRRVRRGQLGPLSDLLRSSRPVQVLVVDAVAAADEAGELSRFHADLGYLGVAHREAFVVQTTLARPGRLVAALDRMAAALRPAVAVVALPTLEPARLRGLRTRAALQGRACPDFVYDPDAGESWADRFDLDGNPAPEAAWATETISYRGADGADETLEAAFTFADAVALEPRYVAHFRVVPADAWSVEQVPLAEWIAKPVESQARWVPFLWIVDDDRNLQRAIVTRELAFATRDRLRGWHVLQELGGYDNAFVARAAEAGRAAASAEADARIAALQAEHEVEVTRVRDETAREALERLAAVLMDADNLAPAAPRAAAPAAPATTAAAPAEAAPAEEPAAVVEEEEDDDLSFDEPYIDTVLCTSCNECINMNSAVFKYNADKQAQLADPKAATFLLLVKAAEACAALCIHPGKPRGDDTTVTPDLVERAKAFQ